MAGDGGIADSRYTPPASLSPAAQQQQAAAAAEGEGDSEECVVCWEGRPRTVLVPCGHLVLCQRCAAGLMAGPAPPLCPVCRQGVALAQPVFL